MSWHVWMLLGCRKRGIRGRESYLKARLTLGERPLISKVLSGHSPQKCLIAALTWGGERRDGCWGEVPGNWRRGQGRCSVPWKHSCTSQKPLLLDVTCTGHLFQMGNSDALSKCLGYTSRSIWVTEFLSLYLTHIWFHICLLQHGDWGTGNSWIHSLDF